MTKTCLVLIGVLAVVARAQTTRPARELAAALATAAPEATIVVGDGTIAGGLVVRTPGVTIRAANKWRVILAGAPVHGIQILAPRVTLDGLVVLGAVYSGIKTEADETTIRRCWVRHNGLNGIEAHNRRGTRIEDCLIERNGTHPNLCHGIYADGEGGRVTGNVVRHNAAMGIALGGQAAGFLIARNVCHDNGTDGIGVWRFRGPANRIERNTLARNRYGLRLVGLGGDVVAGNALWRNRSGEFLNQTAATIPAQGACPAFVDPDYGVWWPTAKTSVGAYDHDPARSRAAWPYAPWAYPFDPARGQPDLWNAE